MRFAPASKVPALLALSPDKKRMVSEPAGVGVDDDLILLAAENVVIDERNLCPFRDQWREELLTLADLAEDGRMRLWRQGPVHGQFRRQVKFQSGVFDLHPKKVEGAIELLA